MEIRHATKTDLPRMMEIYAYARSFMAKVGNPNQWGPTNWPPEELLLEDIRQGKSYVCLEEGRIIGTFYFNCGKDIEPTYAVIEDGAWLSDTPYGVVHRIASDGTVKGTVYPDHAEYMQDDILAADPLCRLSGQDKTDC